MPKDKSYIIRWNSGYGDCHEEVQAADEDEARKLAYEHYRDDCEQQADYEVLGEATDELREDYL